MIFIPTCIPSKEMVVLINQIVNRDDNLKNDIIIVNDHVEDIDNNKYFNELKKLNIKIIENTYPRGKGSAIKSALNYCLENNARYALFADSDGQHDFEDVLNIHRLGESTKSFVIGSRNFDSNVPMRNKLGNKLSSFLFYAVSGIKLKDTQCGLRYIPRRFFKMLVKLNLQNFDFEMYSLFKIIQIDKIIQEDIKTIYSKENYITNFRVFIDSFKIILVFIKIFIKIRKESKKINK